jgi:NAD(P)-dependent dehydrogenase (short-subunit alcohol dehydrogenase family)
LGPAPAQAAVVTGGGSGLGRAVSYRLARNGAAVAVLDRDLPAAQETVDKIVGAGGAATAIEVDVADWDSAAAAMRLVVLALGEPSSLVNCAAIQRFGRAHEVDPADWRRIVDVNLIGTYHMCRAVLPHLMNQPGAAIVNVASTAGLAGIPYSSAYCAAKGGVVQLTKALAIEYSQERIRVNAVAPGGMNTPMLDVPFPDDASPLLLSRVRRSLIGVAEPDDVANVVAFLVSAEAAYITGAVVVADGGALA